MSRRLKVAMTILLIFSASMIVLSTIYYYKKFEMYPFQAPTGIVNTASIQLDGNLTLLVYDDTKTTETYSLDWGQFEIVSAVGETSKWKRKDLWFFINSTTLNKLYWTATNPTYIETEILYENNNTWFKWNTNSPLLVGKWTHISIYVRVVYEPNLPSTFSYEYIISNP